ncbi:MAG: hypothetical protein ACXVPQ_09835 [Bacteroidia bacterium]
MKQKRSALFLFALTFAVAGIAQQNDMDYFAGKWQFEGWLAANTTQQPDYKAVWYIEKSLDSAICFTGRVEINASVFTREIISYNAFKKEFSRNIVTNNGDSFTFTTKGWKGQTLTWQGKQFSKGKETTLKEELNRTGPDEFSAIFYKLEHGTWVPTQKESLKKSNS